MVCRLFGAKQLPEPMLTYCQLDHWEETFVQENAFENFVRELAAILSSGSLSIQQHEKKYMNGPITFQNWTTAIDHNLGNSYMVLIIGILIIHAINTTTG